MQIKKAVTCLTKWGEKMEEIKIDPDKIDELYQTLFEERNSAESMIQKLIQFKENLEEQGIDDNSLSSVHYYLDTLINLMEVLGSGIEVLQENATAIADQFSLTDKHLSNMYGASSVTTTSYSTYEKDQLKKKYGYQYLH